MSESSNLRDRLDQLSPERRALLTKLLGSSNRSESDPASSGPTVTPDPEHRHDPFPLTSLQQAYWVGRSLPFDLGSPLASRAYLEIATQNLDADRLFRAWNTLIDRHEMLRSVVQDDGMQRILADAPIVAPDVRDLRDSVDSPAQRGEIKREMLDDPRGADDWPLCRLIVSRETSEAWHIHLCFDLLVVDAGSITTLVRELSSYYEGETRPGPRPTLSFRDYVLALDEAEDGPDVQRDRAYWEERMRDLPGPPDVPLAQSPSAITAPRFRRRTHRVDAATWEAVKRNARSRGLTANAVLLAVYAETLDVWSHTSRFCVNIPLFNRLPLHPEVDEIVGDFTSVELLVVEPNTEGSFEARARAVQTRLWEDLEHRRVDGVEVLRDKMREEGRDARGIIPYVFTSLLEHDFNRSVERLGTITDSVNQTAQVWVDLHVDEDDDGLIVKWDAVEGLFPEGMMDDMAQSYTNLVDDLADASAWTGQRQSHLPDRHLQAHDALNDTDAPIPEGLLHERFADQVVQRPDHAAVVTDEVTLTYQELFERANRVGRVLREKGARPNRLIGIVMEKGWEQVVAVMGTLTSGAAYLPIDPDFPAERIAYLLDHGEVDLVLTQSHVADRVSWPAGIERLNVDDETVWADTSADPLDTAQTPRDLAYVLYTSGTTGRPKGAMIEHRNVVHRMLDVNERFGITHEDRVIAITALVHDLSVFDLFATLMAGATLVVPDHDQRRDPKHWAELCATRGVTVWNSVPAFVEAFVDYLELLSSATKRPSALRMVMMSGDWVPVTLPDRLRAQVLGVKAISLGGPTETTVWDICYPVGVVNPDWTSIPYGRPMANSRYYIFDSQMRLCPEWVAGELYIGGVGLARGFWNDPETTAEKFFEHPETGERLYRSGDTGRLKPDGHIEFMGRADFQIKLRGLRIEPGEIEAALRQHGSVHESIVTVVGDSNANKQLVAYVVPEGADANVERANASAALTSPPVGGDGAASGAEDASPEVGADEAAYAMKRLAFKMEQRGLRSKEGVASVPLGDSAEDNRRDRFLSRQSFRRFESEAMPLSRLADSLRSLYQMELADVPFPKSLYPSAGGLYAVQAYLYVKGGRVQGLDGGVYYYHPRRHELVMITPGAEIAADVHTPNNFYIHEGAAFGVFLVGKMSAIEPMYGEAARDFCLLEAGYIGQQLQADGFDHNVGFCPVGGVDFDCIRSHFDLDDDHVYLHALMGGAISDEQKTVFAVVEEAN
ncbi:amino acid adenylation domain-containing protein, partial [Longibacter sp.]|uniref:amino acid adenylation domain-containing protein n=1 Tax=Longibacter sp. TaxID=2045415 RepID=UPI003EBBD861